jgi:Inward rectifier potassium channel C-terminal domain
MLFSMLFNAFLFAFFYSQVASPDNRGAQILFSNKAIISIVDGQARFQVRVFDIDASNPVVEAHIRMYVVTKSRPVPRPMRLLQPNDELHSMLFLSLPYVALHHIDIYSLLHPPRNAPVNPSGLLLRQIDSYTANREEFACPICGESYCSEKQYRNHIQYMVEIETEDGFPVTGTHLSIAKSEYTGPSNGRFAPTTDINELKEHFLMEISEIVCVVEGIEPISSGTFAGVSVPMVVGFSNLETHTCALLFVQLHSYTFDEIVFKAEATFSPCCSAVEENSKRKNPTGYVSVDLDRFHDIDNL